MTGGRAKIAASSVEMRIGGAPPRSHFEFDDRGGVAGGDVRGLLQECVKRGILFGAPILPSSHGRRRRSDDRGRRQALAVIADALHTGTAQAHGGEIPAIIGPRRQARRVG